MEKFLTIVEAIFSAFGTAISGLTGGIKDGFMELIYVDAAVENPEINPLFWFIAVTGGVAIASGIVWKLFGLIKGKIGR